ncbi:MAG TPA: methyltransferase domain-containing protein [Solirubrobacterales bacterium]|nr:methyltransferase domain-containing protein [Solirubrobacterales bacterium]
MSIPPLTPLAAAVLRVGQPERVLQLECGEGDGVLFLAREFPQARVRGLDRSARAVRAAQDRVGLDPEGRVAFKVGRPGALPFPDDHFDLVAALDATPRPAEIARVLRPGGFLVLAWSERSRAPRGPRRRLLDWSLRRARIDRLAEEDAGDGSFALARLGGGGTRPGAG